MSKVKRKHGDRKDAYLVRDSDVMHIFMPFLLPNRADNEAVLNETVDLTAIIDYVNQKNANSPEFKYTMFHVFCAALAKVITLRPKLNYFYSGQRLYEKKDLTLAFVVKKHFTDKGEETLAIIEIDKESEESPVEQVYNKVKNIVYDVRKSEKSDGATDFMSVFSKAPRCFVRFFIKIINILEYYGKLPQSLLKIDPYHSSVFLSNLGSIKMKANYHHLTNWGTNSLFVVIGEKFKRPYYDDDGNVTMKESLELGITIDERIADGVYFSNSIKILRKIFEHPEVLDLPLNTPID
ncbi:MAG: hypothetical protein IJQ50_00765 [Clostridia bacterium]|nr:hypothetical protein [Clostridia bacterium]